MSACPSCRTLRSTSKRYGSEFSAGALERSRVLSPFLLRSVDPSIEAANGASVVALERLGKRIAIGFDSDVWLVLHLMIAGRLQWRTELAGVVHAPNGPGARVRERHVVAHGGRHQEASFTACRAWADGARGASAGRNRARSRDSRRVRGGAQAPQSHAETRANRPALDQRHRQCLLRRNTAPGALVARRSDEPFDVRRICALVQPRLGTCWALGCSGCEARRAASFRAR